MNRQMSEEKMNSSHSIQMSALESTARRGKPNYIWRIDMHITIAE